MPASKRPFRALCLLTLLCAVGVLLSGHGAQASAINDCIDACFSGAHCSDASPEGQDQYICQSSRDRCVAQCNQNISQGTAEPAPVTGAYGAIAYDKASGAWGMADASQSKSKAEKSALAYCGQSSCEIVESFSNSCAAIAAGTGDRLAWAVNADARQAGLDAIQKCGTRTSGNDHSRCFLQLYHCYAP